jgi:uncharacterized membrane protein
MPETKPETYTVFIHRSKEWLQAIRLKTGRNVPEEIQVEVDPATLSEDARAIWLEAGADMYQTFYKLGYYQNHEGVSCNYCGWGSIQFVIDTETPTPVQISATIVAARAEVRAMKEKADQERAKQNAEEVEKKRLADETNKRQADAREILKEELAKLTKERDYYKAETARLKEAIDAEEVDA